MVDKQETYKGPRRGSGHENVDLDFCRRLPKVELHAHLSGSVSPKCLQELWNARKSIEPSFSLDPPEVALVKEKRGQDISVFFSHFSSYVYHLLSTPRALSYAIISLLSEFAETGIVYCEIRTTPRPLPGRPNSSAADKQHTSTEETIDLILDAFERWNSHPEHGRRMQARLILSIDRSKHSPSDAERIVSLALSLRAAGRPVVGVDLSGDVEVSLRDYSAAFKKAAEGQPTPLPASIHFAEVPNSSSEKELETLLSYQPARLGHVIHVPMEMRREIVERDIPVELLLTCNILGNMLPRIDDPARDTKMGAMPDYADHHFSWWHANARSLSIGTDDVGVFGSNLSEEYALVAQHFGLGRRELIHLAERSVTGIFDEEQKERVNEAIRKFGSTL